MRNLLANCDTNKSPGPDNIHAAFLKQVASEIATLLTHLFWGVARLINWLGTAGLLTALIECLTVILEYIDLFQFLLVGHSQLLVGPGPYQAHPWLRLCIYSISH